MSLFKSSLAFKLRQSINSRIIGSFQYQCIKSPNLIQHRNYWWSKATPGLTAESIPSTTSKITVPDTIVIDDTIMGSSLVDVVSTIPKVDATIITSIEKIGDLHSLGLASYYTLPGWFQWGLEYLYVVGNLPWWAAIILGCTVVKIILLPTAIKAQRGIAHLALIKPKMEPISNEIKRLKSIGDNVGATTQSHKLQKLLQTEGVNPFGALWGMVQIPFFISIFFALRSMTELPIPGFETGGLLWFLDLTVKDPYYALPILSALFMIAGTELNKVGTSESARKFMRIFSIIAIPLFGWLPAGIFLSTFSSTILNIVQVWLLRQPAVMKRFDIPKIPKELATNTKGMLSQKPLTFSQAFTQIYDTQKQLK
ncbi:60Kd inner membrane protein-domain-containing protein [Globomyces pollinis-pini]|nr:60Kd inner membrane protein-domain-containing protein [Globomyces pollinis-pini]